jgi:hypothetical protein
MKKGLSISLMALCAGIFSVINVNGQDTTTIGQDIKAVGKETGKVVKKGAKEVGNKTAELASKGKADVVDKKYDGKQGPNGETIYINDKAKFYWIDKKGHRHYITEAELKDKED